MLLIATILFPMIAGICVCAPKGLASRTRRALLICAMLASDALGALAILRGSDITLCALSANVYIGFAPDGIGRLFLAAVLIMYTAACFYSFEYMRDEARPNMFFAFFFISLGALESVALARNLVTVYLCFELATLASVPLVLHELDRDSILAGRKYLFYSVGGALMGLFAVFFIYSCAGGSAEFRFGGFIDPARIAGREGLFLAAVFTGIIGFGTKAGIYPMHGWLPTAHPIAPAPASALLSGIIAKAGVLAVIRLVYYSVGAELLRGTWVQRVWMIIALVTIFMGSMMAFREKVLKKRLAYSTISQISYILLALSLLTEDGLRAGLLHLLAHAFSKGCLFLCAGVFIHKLGRREVGQLRGVGSIMPVTMWCFTIASLSLVGIPPLGGFLSKWQIAQAAITSGEGVWAILPPAVLLISALLTAGYLLPVVVDAFFPGEEFKQTLPNSEPSALMTAPMLALCALALAVGVWGIALTGAVAL